MSIIKNNIDSTEEYILQSVGISKKIEREYWQIILDQLDKLDSEAGILIFGKKSADTINEIMLAIRKAIEKGGYRNELSKVLKQIGDVDEAGLKVIEALNDRSIDISTVLDRDFLGKEIVERIASPESFKTNIENEVRRIIGKNIYFQSSIKTLKDELKEAVLSSTNNGGILSRYVTQVATDTVYQYKGTVNQKIEEKYNLNAISYLGSIIRTSRPQCIRWVEDFHGIILKDKIEDSKFAYLPNEVKWAKTNGKGYGEKGKPYYLDLTVNNFTVIRGGYGCRHEAIPFKYSEKAANRTKRFSDEHTKYLEEINQDNE